MTEKSRTEVGDAAPGSLAEMVGQQSVMLQVSTALAAAQADNRRFPDSLLVGPPGVGKSQVSKLIAHSMNTKVYEVLGQSLKSAADLNCLLLEVEEDRAVVHVDEAHEIDKMNQTALLYALDERRVFLQGSKSGPQSIPISDFTLLLSTTDEFCLVHPLRDRMKLVLRFLFYSVEELTTILDRRSKALGWPVDERVLPFIAERSRGTPRLTLRLLSACRRACRADHQSEITLEHMRCASVMEQIDCLGLGPIERQYLDFLVSGGSGLWAIASTLGLPARTLSVVIEPFLLREGLIIKDERSRRQLTVKGRDHLSRTTTEEPA